MGDTLVGTTADVTVTVTDAAGQHLRLLRNGAETAVVDISSSPFTYTFTADRAADEGSLGTFWGVQTFDDVSLTTISNPIFLADRAPTTTAPAAAPTTAVTTAPSTRSGTGSGPRSTDGTSSSWRGPWTAFAAMGLVTTGLVVARRRLRRH